jgi:hypothetical protein
MGSISEDREALCEILGLEPERGHGETERYVDEHAHAAMLSHKQPAASMQHRDD